MTCRCCSKLSMQLTKPTSLTTRLMRSRSPSSCFRVARMFNATCSAATRPCSTFRSWPTLPVIRSPSGGRGRWPATYRANSNDTGAHGRARLINDHALACPRMVPHALRDNVGGRTRVACKLDGITAKQMVFRTSEYQVASSGRRYVTSFRRTN